MTLLPLCSKFVYGSGTVLAMELPITPWVPSVNTIGGSIEADSGMNASFVVRTDEVMSFTLRFREEQWPDVQAFIDFGQTGMEIAWYPDQAEDAVFVCYLDSPAVGTKYNAIANVSYPRVLQLSISLVRPGGSPWSLPDFVNRHPDEPPPVIPLPPGWVIHIFVGIFSDAFAVLAGHGNAEILVVAGAGSGGSVDGFNVGAGGGGGGGVIHELEYPITVGTYFVTIGGGGVAPAADHTIGGGAFGVLPGNNGDDSSFGGLTAIGGGGGGGSDATIERQGRAGGCGGGAASAFDASPGPDAYAGGLGTSGQGFDGGSGTHSTSAVGGGGGGAGAPGGSGGAPGDGIQSDITNVDGIFFEYGRGGGATFGGARPAGQDGRGEGGTGGGQNFDSDGGNGGAGIVVVKYRMETGIIATGGTRTEYPDA